MKIRLIARIEDGGITVVHPAPNSKREDETEDQWLKRVFDKATPRGAEYVDVDKVTVLSQLLDRTFRNAWIKNGSGISVDMPKAREIHMDRIREKRNEKLSELDIPFLQAVADNDSTKEAEIKTQKQVLCNLPQTFDLTVAKTPEALKALWPTELE